MTMYYKVVEEMGWVDFDFGCSTVCQILLVQMGIWQNWLGTQATWWKIQFNHVPDHFCHHVLILGC